MDELNTAASGLLWGKVAKGHREWDKMSDLSSAVSYVKEGIQ